MKRPSYRMAVEWAALNDESAATDPEEVAGTISVCLVADIFGLDVARVVRDVLRVRARVFGGG